jgi:hypothetical protein
MSMAVVYTWTGVVPGREKLAVSKYRDDTARLHRLKDEGKITDFSWFVDTQGSGGMLVVWADPTQISRLSEDGDGAASRILSSLVTENWCWSVHTAGESVEATMAAFDAAADRL